MGKVSMDTESVIAWGEACLSDLDQLVDWDDEHNTGDKEVPVRMEVLRDLRRYVYFTTGHYRWHVAEAKEATPDA